MLENKKLQWPGMSLEKKKQQAEMIAVCRKILAKEPSHDSTAEAVKAAVSRLKRDERSNPSVWQEPSDMGTKKIVLHRDDRENAGVAGYEEKVTFAEILAIADGRRRSHLDEIEEV